MLQQTQAARVVPKFLAWMDRFPDASCLAKAALPELLEAWSGLGYNRRALALHRAAGMIAAQPGASLPPDEAFLLSLPGVGPYTARAVLAFAFDIPGVFLETNIRTVILKHYFPGLKGVRDAELERVAAAVLDAKSPRNWYNALMDYGAEIKRTEGNHSRRASGYARQAPFATSFRRVRGAMLKYLVERGESSLEEMRAALPFSMEDLEKGAAALIAEGFAGYCDTEYRDAGYRGAGSREARFSGSRLSIRK
jgi:A/G-specific adenine glycosylase